MVSYLYTKTSSIFSIVIPEKISLTIEETHSLSSKYISNIYIDDPHWVQVTSLVQIHTNMMLFYQPCIYMAIGGTIPVNFSI